MGIGSSSSHFALGDHSLHRARGVEGQDNRQGLHEGHQKHDHDLELGERDIIIMKGREHKYVLARDLISGLEPTDHDAVGPVGELVPGRLVVGEAGRFGRLYSLSHGLAGGARDDLVLLGLVGLAFYACCAFRCGPLQGAGGCCEQQ